MSKILLLIPEVVAKVQFEGCSVVPHRNRWPVISDVPSGSLLTECSYVAATSSTDADSVRRMIRILTVVRECDRRIVFADEAIPMSLRAVFPKTLCSILQRAIPSDLICVSKAVAQRAAASDTFCRVADGAELEYGFVLDAPTMERFPQAGPGSDMAGCGRSGATLTTAIDAALAGSKVADVERKCMTSGILLLWDFLHESHEISQTMEGRTNPGTADYWHGIMHRREPDAGNAAYWFRRVGLHPAFATLVSNLDGWMKETGASDEEIALAKRKLISNDAFDPLAVIELSTKAIRKPGQLEDRTLRRVQYLEILNLLAWSLGTS